jgi:tRNA(Ile)-lysidine synthetase-like protein
MTADRPPRAAVRAAVRDALADLEPGDRVLVALSGGADSLALLAATVAVCADRGLVCASVVVDHGLQPESAAIARRAADQARIIGCSDVEVVRAQVATGPGSGGPEAAARAARYAALEQAAAGGGPTGSGPPPAAAILLGHTRDDQAETVLLGLARGSGTRSLAGMAPRSGMYRRPLLGLPRAVVAAAAAEAAASDPRLVPWQDPHNDDPGFARVRVRTSVLPLLERELGPGIADALARTAELARADADALDAWADRVWERFRDADRVWERWQSADGSVSGGVLLNLGQEATRFAAGAGAGAGPGAAVGAVPPPPVRATLPIEGLLPSAADPLPAAIVSRLVRRLLLAAGCPPDGLTAGHVRAVMALIGPTGARAEVALPGGLGARREGGDLVVRA